MALLLARRSSVRFNGAMSTGDSVLRAMTDDGAFRIIVAKTSQTTQEARSGQDLPSDRLGAMFSDLITSAVLYRETMAPTLRVQCILQGADESGRLIADSHPDGWSRGLCQVPDQDVGLILGGDGALLHMMRTLPSGDLHRGVVAVHRNGNLSQAMMGYMHQSEQTVCMSSVSTSASPIWQSGGYLMQLLPEAPEAEGALAIMTERLRDFERLDAWLHGADADPAALVEEIFYGMPHTTLQSTPLRFGCNCSRVRVMTSLSTLGRDEIQEMIDEGKPIDLSCDYCGTSYAVEPAQLRGLISAS